MDTCIATARAMIAGDKGLLAMDESTGTCNKRFAEIGVAQTLEMRRAYRDMIVTAPGLGDCLNGAILVDETLRQTTVAGEPFASALQRSGIIPGIKVDAGAQAMAGFAGEKITEGLDGLRARLADYAKLGARFAKWRAVLTIGPGLPTPANLAANAHALARYAALCQEAGLTPIVEPETLMDGVHDLETCRVATEAALAALFAALIEQRVVLEGVILKPNMVLAGLDCPTQPDVEDVAAATVNTLLRRVPAAVPGVAFLSGGQPPELASARLSAMNKRYRSSAPWALAFSYARAIQQPALEIWRGEAKNVAAAQKALVHRARCNVAARRGQYDAETEHAA